MELAAISTRFFHGDALRAVLRRYGGVPAARTPRKGATVRAHYCEGYGPVDFARALPHVPHTSVAPRRKMHLNSTHCYENHDFPGL